MGTKDSIKCVSETIRCYLRQETSTGNTTSVKVGLLNEEQSTTIRVVEKTLHGHLEKKVTKWETKVKSIAGHVTPEVASGSRKKKRSKYDPRPQEEDMISLTGRKVATPASSCSSGKGTGAICLSKT